MSELFTCSTILKFVNVLDKPPCMKAITTSYVATHTLESVITWQWRKLMPPILSTNHCVPPACAPILTFAPIHSFTRQIVRTFLISKFLAVC